MGISSKSSGFYRSLRWSWELLAGRRFELSILRFPAVSPQRSVSQLRPSLQDSVWLTIGLIISTVTPRGPAPNAQPLSPAPSIWWRRGMASVPTKTEASSVSEIIQGLILVSALPGPQGPRRSRKKQIGDPQASTNNCIIIYSCKLLTNILWNRNILFSKNQIQFLMWSNRIKEKLWSVNLYTSYLVPKYFWVHICNISFSDFHFNPFRNFTKRLSFLFSKKKIHHFAEFQTSN